MKKLLLSFLLFMVTAFGFAQWSANPRINTLVAGGTNSQHPSKSIADGLGGIIVLYSEQFYNTATTQWNSTLYAQRLDANGVAQWGIGGKQIVTSLYQYIDSYIISDGNGGMVVLYTKHLTSGNYYETKIYAQRINANGDKQWGAGTDIEITPTTSDYSSDNMLFDNNGFVFTYSQGDDIYMQKLNMNGVLQWGANGVKINDAAGEYEGSQVIKSGTGYLLLFGEEYEINLDDEGYRIYWQKLDANGNKMGANLLLENLMPSGGYHYELDGGLVPDGNGGIYYTIEAENDTDSKTYLQHVNSNGVKQLTSTAWGMLLDQEASAFASDGAGGVIITYEAGTINGLYAQRFNSAGTKLWGNDGVLLLQGNNLSSFYDDRGIKINTDGDFIFAIDKYIEYTSGYNTHTYIQKVSPTGTVLYAAEGVLVAGSNAGKREGEAVISGNKTILVWSENRNSANGDDIYAQSIFNNGSLTGTFPVLNVNTTKGFNTIQNAINDAATQNGHEIQIAAGIYTENITVNKEVTLKGNNAGLAPWNWINSPTIVNPPNTAFSYANALITIAAHNVSIDGISFDGTNSNNPNIGPDGVSSRTINGKVVHTGLGVVTGGGDVFNAPKIINNKLENFTNRAIEIYSIGSKRSMEISNNQIDNVVAINTTSAAGIAYGISTSGFSGEMKNNRVTRASTGIDMQFPFNFANDNVNALNNTVEAYKTGMAFRGATTITAPIITVADNNIDIANYNTWTGDGLNKNGINLTGMYFVSLAGDNNITASNNNVSNANWGISTSLIQKSAVNVNRFTISGGILNNNFLGVDNYTATNNTYTSRVVLSGVNITNSGFTGARNFSTAGSFKSELVLKDGVQIVNIAPATTYLNAITIEGTNAQLNELNDTKISGARTNFIALTNSAMTGLTVDGKDVTYDGTVNGQTFNNYKPSATFDLTLRSAVKARIQDGEDAGNTTAGIVTIPSTLPVSLIDFNASLKNNGALITWSTESELNNKNFLVEKSNDGISFNTIATINGKGTTAVKSSYQFTDVNFFQPAYYRLTQVDLNGTKTVYDELIRHVKGLGEDKITVYPNPTTDKINIKLPFSVLATKVKLIDVNGKTLDSKAAHGGQVVTFTMQHLPKGLYLVQYTDGGKLITEKVVKH